METTNSAQEIDIQKYLLVFKRRWWIIVGVFVTFATLGGALSEIQPTTYQATGKLLFQTNRTSSLTGVGGKIGDLESIGTNPLDTQALLVTSNPIIKEVIDTLNLKDEKGEPLQPRAIQIGLGVGTIIGTDGLMVSYTSKDPNLAKQIVDQVMKSYIANNILTNRSEAIAAGNFINKQLPAAKIELDQTQKVLLQFKRQNQIVNLQEETSELVKNSLTLDNEINNARVQIAELNTREKQILGQINLPIKKAVDVSSLSQASGIQELLSELQKTQIQLKVQQIRYTDANPIIADLKNQEAALSALLKQRITEYLGHPIQIDLGKLQLGEIKRELPLELEKLQSQRLSLEKRIKSFASLRESYSRRISAIPNLEKSQGEIEQKLSLAQKNYENLSLKSQEIKIVESQTIGNARILEEAEVGSSASAGKKKGLVLIVGVFGGLILGIAVAFLVDIIDRRVKTVREAEGMFNYTLLGLIPIFEKNNNNTLKSEDLTLEGAFNPVIVQTSPRSMIHEAFGMLQANLKFISLDKKIRTIALTSSIPGEGKSQIAANLAAFMAQTGRRVLLIDGDLRRPSQHHLWNLINSTGLSNVVVDEEQLQQSIHKITPYLSVLTSGVIPPNPLAIIDSEGMRSLLDRLSKEYDYIILDTPPLLGNADGVVLTKIADGVLVVVRIGIVDSTSITTAKTLLSRSEVNVLGIVANAVDTQQEPNYFYYHSQPSEKSVEKVGR